MRGARDDYADETRRKGIEGNWSIFETFSQHHFKGDRKNMNPNQPSQDVSR